MRYVVVVVAFLLYTGFIFDIAPLHVLLTWSVLATLAASAVVGSRRGDRERALQRQVFLNDSLLGYHESVAEHRRRGQDR